MTTPNIESRVTHLPVPEPIEALISGYYRPVELAEIGLTIKDGDGKPFDEGKRKLVYIAGVITDKNETKIFCSSMRDYKVDDSGPIFSHGLSIEKLVHYKPIKKID